ncbi:MAG: hypothetical protein AB8Y17_01255, partial [Coxiella endosymbiont of Dermacentor silvarum]
LSSCLLSVACESIRIILTSSCKHFFIYEFAYVKLAFKAFIDTKDIKISKRFLEFINLYCEFLPSVSILLR